MKNLTSEEFYSALQSNEYEYGKQYLELIDKVKSEHRTKVKGDGNELHHIHPKGLGGNDSDLVILSCYEHCIAHILLAKALPPCRETFCPIIKMSNRVLCCSDLEKLSLEKVYGWSVERQKALHMGRTKESIRKGLITREALGHLKHTESSRYKIQENSRRKAQDLEFLKKLSKANKGRIAVHKNGIIRYAYSQKEYQSLLKDGWVNGTGRKASEETLAKMSKAAKNQVYIYKDGYVKHIHLSKVQEFLKKGWNLGSLVKPFSDHHRKALSEARKGKILVNNGKIAKYMYPEEIPNGWFKGRMKIQ